MNTMALKNKLSYFALGSALLATAVLAGCGGSNNGGDNATGDNAAGGNTAGGATSSVKLNGAGATFPAPLYSKWFSTYNEKTGVQINYQPIGSGGGITALQNQTVDFGASDAVLKADDEKAMPGKILHIPTAAGAVVVVYNLEGVQDLKLSGDVLASIFLGEITKWNDPKIAALNSGVKLPDERISIAYRSDGSGTTNIFTSYLAAVSPSWKTKIGSGKSVDWPTGQGGKGNDGVAANVKQSKGSIGYVELAYAEQNELSYASIRNKAGQFVKPSIEATTAAAQGGLAAIQKDIKAPIINQAGPKAYPISGFTYILIYQQNKDKEKSAALKEFLKWAMTDGQGMAKDLMYAPLPAEVVAINEKAIDSIQ